MRGMPLVSKFTLESQELFESFVRSLLEIRVPDAKPERSRDPQSQRRVNSRDPVIGHDSQAAGEGFGLPRGKRLPNIEDTKKYKAQQQIFPVEQR